MKSVHNWPIEISILPIRPRCGYVVPREKRTFQKD